MPIVLAQVNQQTLIEQSSVKTDKSFEGVCTVDVNAKYSLLELFVHI